MPDRFCEVCGKALTFWNHAWGTDKCGRCAKGRSPEAKREKEEEEVQNHLIGIASLEDILNSPRRAFLIRATLLLFLINSIGLFGHVAGSLTHNGWYYLIEIVSFVIGIKYGGKMLCENTHLLNLKRWRSYWHGNLTGYIIGLIMSLVIVAWARVHAVATSKETAPFVAVMLWASIGLPILIGIILGIMNTIRKELKHVAYVTEKFSEMKQDEKAFLERMKKESNKLIG